MLSGKQREKRSWQALTRVGLRWAAAIAGGVLGLCVGVTAETPAKPSVRLPLSTLGFPGYGMSLLHAGVSMSTVHMLDEGHVLLTYSLRSLVPRVPGDDPNDSDREVAALVLELPSGKVLARAKWHLHDHGRYLWAVGHGRYVLRMGDELSMLMPMEELAAGEDALRRYALPHRPGRPVLVDGGPDGKVLTVELEMPRQHAATFGDTEDGREHRQYALEFFRFREPEKVGGPVQMSHAGVIGSPGLLRLAMDGDGYLWAEDNARGRWMVSFNEFGGKQEKLTPVQSSCHPGMQLLSRSQFLVESCRGDQSAMLASYGFDGHENWQEPYGEVLQPPVITSAPNAGRFAISRLAASGGGGPVNGAYQETMLQDVRVYQVESGDLLLKVSCAPVMKSAENFDLSPDGRTLAILATESLDLYRLPGLSAKDQEQLAEAQKMTPPMGTGPVVLPNITRHIADPDETVAANPGTPQQPASSPVAAAPAAAAPTASPRRALTLHMPAQAVDKGAESAGSAAAAEAVPRRPPTLLKSGESADYKGQDSTSAPK